jgi:uncharacterized protein
MAQDRSLQKPLPVVDFLKIPEVGDPYLEGSKCLNCGAIFPGARKICAACGTRNRMETLRLSNKGKLYAYSIVHRSFPGVSVPYISAVVTLEGGCALKGCMINVDPDPGKLAFDMPVQVVFQDAQGRKDKEGNSYISYFFSPEQTKEG